MSTRKAQSVLLTLLVSAFILALGSVTYGYAMRHYFPDEFQALILLILTQFAGPLAVATGSYFAVRSRPRDLPVPMVTFAIAVSLTGVWSLLTAGRVVLFLLSPGEEVPDLVSWSNSVVTAASYVTNAALAYFFSSSSGSA